jgi:hypothetical protein
MGAVRSPAIVLAWLAATAVAVAVSWLGVRTVVHDAVVTPPQLAVPAVAPGTVRPPVPPPVPPTTTSSVAPSTTTSPPSRTASPPTTSQAADVHTYSVRGGQVVLALSGTSATLVSATPANGYTVQTWQETGWLRVDFSAPGDTWSVFATWNGHPPSVQTFDS